MNFAMTFFIFSVAACILFSLGRMVGMSEEAQNQKRKRKSLEELKYDLFQFALNESDFHENEDYEIVEAEYENVVFDLQKYRDERNVTRAIKKNQDDHNME
tara:strand:+ start:145 stop:447 length:303 start_codon:yes stop_codon:yes gene_type:complete